MHLCSIYGSFCVKPAELNSFDKDWPTRAKILTVWPFKKMFADPWYKPLYYPQCGILTLQPYSRKIKKITIYLIKIPVERNYEDCF